MLCYWLQTHLIVYITQRGWHSSNSKEGRKGNWDTILTASWYMGNVPSWIWLHWCWYMWRLEAEICEHGCENLCLMGREDVSEKPVAPASCTLINEGGIFRPHYTASRPSHPSANTTNRGLPQETVNILSSCTTVSVWAAAVCPQDIPAVT